MSVSVYPSLPSATSIRLFHLAPGTLHEPIIGSLDVVDLENKPDYECVSYTWGDASNEEAIFVDSEKVLIRRHLWEALRRMRLSAQPRVLWIDALCISQSDLGEKARQVHMIGKIVHHASRVLAWLGEHADGSEAIFHGWPAEETATANMSRESIPQDFWIRKYEVWLAFYSRRWFSRTWIIQEVAVAKEVRVFCGSDVGHWTTLFEDLMTRIIKNGTTFENFWVVLEGLKGVSTIEVEARVKAYLPNNLLARLEVHFSFLRALVDTRRKYRDRNSGLDGLRGLPFEWFSSNAVATKCLDRRDKIYALRSIIYGPGAEPSHGILVDYTIDAVGLMLRSLDCRFIPETSPFPYLARNLILLLELSYHEVNAVLDLIASEPSQLSRFRVAVLAYACVTDAGTPKEITSKLFGISGDSRKWIYDDSWISTSSCAKKLLRWHSVKKAGGDMYSLLEDASMSNP